jgi:hypothetical protein
MKFIISAVLLLLVSLNAHAGVKKWVDADGNTHYSDTSPNTDEQTESVRNFAGKDQGNASAANTPKSYVEIEAERRRAKKQKQEASDKQAEEDARAASKKQNCEAARQNAKTLEESPRISTFDDKGQPTLMDDSERAKRLEEARKAITENCN